MVTIKGYRPDICSITNPMAVKSRFKVCDGKRIKNTKGNFFRIYPHSMKVGKKSGVKQRQLRNGKKKSPFSMNTKACEDCLEWGSKGSMQRT